MVTQDPRRNLAGLVARALLAVALALFVAGLAVAADVTASLDRNRVVEGETVTLVLQTDDPQQSLETDFTALAGDFDVVDRRSETRMSIVGGRQTAEVRLLVTLEPRRSGILTVPALEFRGGSRTQPLSLTVEPAPQPAPGELPAVFIEIEVDPQEGPYYVHAQLSLKVRIFYQQNLTEAAIKPPEPEQASVRLLDEVPYQADRNGQTYRVLERRYAVFPERSGTLTIPPMQLTGKLIERPSDRLWQPAVRGRRVRVESDPLVLDVSPRPASFSGVQWLPARRVDLAQQITDGDTVTVGEPVTRTVILEAVGLDEHMLEEPAWPEVANARIYPDQPQGISRDDGQWVLGNREYRYAVVPETPGELVLPEIRLPWWDTVNNVERVAILPEHRVTVLPSALAVAPPATPAANSAGDGWSGPGDRVDVRRWQVVSGALALLWFATLALWAHSRRRPAPAAPRTAVPAEGQKQVLNDLKNACRSSDPRAAHAALARWLRRFGPPAVAGRPTVLARRVDDASLAAAIGALDAVAYGGADEGDWDGASLWRAFDRWRRAGAQLGGAAPAASDAVDDDLDLYAPAR